MSGSKKQTLIVRLLFFSLKFNAKLKESNRVKVKTLGILKSDNQNVKIFQ